MQPELTLIQESILYTMYRMELTPGAKFKPSKKIIAETISIWGYTFTDSIWEYVDEFYSLAQPWIIKEPLIKCHGNIGSPVEIEDAHSGAAGPLYTEAVLTDAGVKYILEQDIMNLPRKYDVWNDFHQDDPRNFPLSREKVLYNNSKFIP